MKSQRLKEVLRKVSFEQAIIILYDYHNGHKTVNEIYSKFKKGHYNNALVADQNPPRENLVANLQGVNAAAFGC